MVRSEIPFQLPVHKSCFPSGSNLLRTVLRRTVHWFVPLGTLNLLLHCPLSLVSSESDSRRIFDIS
jgi:hypothetical protein